MHAPVIAQVSRSARQAQLRRFLRGCDVVAFTLEEAHGVGRLLGLAGSPDVVDAHLVLTAAKRNAIVLSSDPDDLERLSNKLRTPVRISRL